MNTDISQKIYYIKLCKVFINISNIESISEPKRDENIFKFSVFMSSGKEIEIWGSLDKVKSQFDDLMNHWLNYHQK